ncbi:metallo-beta-lactamase [Thermodesulfobacteriota bacterium]
MKKNISTGDKLNFVRTASSLLPALGDIPVPEFSSTNIKNFGANLALSTENYKLRVAPFHIVGNIYYVGDYFNPSYLIDTGEGLVLLDTPMPTAAYMLFQSIWELGFNPKDIKYVIHSHYHGDHTGSTAPLVDIFGAKTVISAVDAKVMEENAKKGVIAGPGGFSFAPFKPDILLENGDTFTFGNLKIRAVLCPGHTPGTMTYFWDMEHNGKTYTCATFGGTGFNTLSVAACKKYGTPLSIRDEFINSLNKVRNEKVDIHIGNHAFQSFMFQKSEIDKKNGNDGSVYIDSTEWQWYIDKTLEAYKAFRAEDDKNL